MDQVKFVEDNLYKFWSDMVWSTSADHITSDFLKAVFHKLQLVHSWIFCPIYTLTLFATLVFFNTSNLVHCCWKDIFLTSVYAGVPWSSIFINQLPSVDFFVCLSVFQNDFIDTLSAYFLQYFQMIQLMLLIHHINRQFCSDNIF